MQKIKAAIVGYGNVGSYIVEALVDAPDFEIRGIVRRGDSLKKEQPQKIQSFQIAASLEELGEVDVALLALPTRQVSEHAQRILPAGINTVDSYDLHGPHLLELKSQLDPVAKKSGAVAVIAAGWDPGTDSIIRALFSFMAPKGITYTNFGPGMSMGHSVAVKALDGVLKALALTTPKGTGLHRRLVYVELEEGADFQSIQNQILKDPYFSKDETYVYPVEQIEPLVDMGHGVSMQRKGSSGETHNQNFQLQMQVNNPALTAQVMVAAARASTRQKPGCYTLLEIPIIDFLPGDPEKSILDLV